MKKKRVIEFTTLVIIEVDSDKLDYGVTGGAIHEDAMRETVQAFIGNMQHEVSIDLPGVSIITQQLESYTSRPI